MCRARPGPAKSRRAVGESRPASTWRGGAPDRGPASSALTGGSIPICLQRPGIQSNLSARRKSFLQTESCAAVEYVSADSTDCAINWRVRMGGRAGVHIGKWPPAVLAESTEVRQSTRRFVNSIGVASQSFHIPQCVPFVSLDFAKLLGWPRPFRTMMASPLPSWLSITSIPIRRL